MKTEKQQTAVEWFGEEIFEITLMLFKQKVSDIAWERKLDEILERAKQMEQEQLKSSYQRGKKYKKPLKDSNPIKFNK